MKSKLNTRVELVRPDEPRHAGVLVVLGRADLADEHARCRVGVGDPPARRGRMSWTPSWPQYGWLIPPTHGPRHAGRRAGRGPSPARARRRCGSRRRRGRTRTAGSPRTRRAPPGSTSPGRAAAGSNRWQVPLARPPSGPRRPRPGPPAEDREPVVGRLVAARSPRPSRNRYRARAGEPGSAASASRNHGCSAEVWLGTMSTMHAQAQGVRVASSAAHVVERAERAGRSPGSRRRRSRRPPSATGTRG